MVTSLSSPSSDPHDLWFAANKRKYVNELNEYYQQTIGKILKEYEKTGHLPEELNLSHHNYHWYLLPEQLNKFPSVGKLDPLTSKNLESILPQISSLLPAEFDVVDWCCGNGQKGIKVYQTLPSTGRLYFIDSLFATELAVQNSPSEIVERSFPVNCDVRQTKNIFGEGNSSSRFHLFLGNTISNFREKRDLEEMVHSFTDNMKHHEYLFVEWNIRDTQSYLQGKDFLSERFKIPPFNKLPLAEQMVVKRGEEQITTALPLDKQKELLTASQKWKEFQLCFLLQKDYALGNGLVLKKGLPVVAATIRRFYEEKEIFSLFKDYGLVCKQSWFQEQGYRYALFQKEGKTKKEKRNILKWTALATVAFGGYISLAINLKFPSYEKIRWEEKDGNFEMVSNKRIYIHPVGREPLEKMMESRAVVFSLKDRRKEISEIPKYSQEKIDKWCREELSKHRRGEIENYPLPPLKNK